MLVVCLVYFAGCFGSGSGQSSENQKDTLVFGQVVLPKNELLNVKAGKRSLKEIIVYACKYPNKAVSCDENGNFLLELPKFNGSTDIVAYYKAPSNSFYIKKASAEQNSNTPLIIELEKGVKPLVINFKSTGGAPLRNVKCAYWGKEFYSDFNGTAVSELLLPETVKTAEVLIAPTGLKEFEASLSLLTTDLTPEYTFVLPVEFTNKTPPVICFNTSALYIKPLEEVDITAIISDTTNALKNNYKVQWAASEGEITASSCEHNEKIKYKAPAKEGIATLTASVAGSGFESFISLSIAVGQKHVVNECILSFSPMSGAAGQTVTISGRGFGAFNNSCSVDFGGALGNITLWQDNLIKVEVPRDAETAKLKISNGSWVLTSKDAFTVVDYKITLEPDFGAPGALICLTGYGFGSKPDPSSPTRSKLLLDGEEVKNIASWSNTQISFKVESNAVSGPISVEIRGREHKAAYFTVSAVNKFEPKTTTRLVLEELPDSIEQTVIKIKGQGFCSVDSNKMPADSAVSFCGVDTNGQNVFIEAKCISWRHNQIEVILPKRAVSGPIMVKINGTVIETTNHIEINAAKGYSKHDSSWGAYLAEVNPLISDVCKTEEYVVLADMSNSLLWFLNPTTGKTDKTVNLFNSADGKVPVPCALTCFNSGGDEFTYVSDIANNQILKLASDGARLAAAAVQSTPRGLFADKTGRIFAAAEGDNNGDNKILVFDESLNKIDGFSFNLGAEGSFNEPYDVFISGGRLFVPDAENNAVYCFKRENDGKTFNLECSYGKPTNGTAGRHSGFIRGIASEDECAFYGPKAVYASGTWLYVADSGNNRIQKINIINGQSTIFGAEGNNDGQYKNPTGICLDGDSLIYAADSQNSRVQKISCTGEHILSLKPDVEGMGISFSDVAFYDDELYVLDSDDCSISVFDMYGDFCKKIGFEGSGKGQLKGPMGICINSAGDIITADTLNDRVSVFSASGEYLHFGVHGSGNGQFNAPLQVNVDEKDNIYVSDKEGRVQVFSSSGTYITTFGKGILNNPGSIAFSSRGDIFVADTGHHRVCRFDKAYQFVGWYGSNGTNNGYFTPGSTSYAPNTKPCGFVNPTYLAVDFEDCLYVSDVSASADDRGDIQKFDIYSNKPKGGYIENIKAAETDSFYGIALNGGGCVFAATSEQVNLYCPTR